MDEERQTAENGLTVGDIFRMIKKRLWIVLTSCIVFTLTCVLLLVFLINPRLTTYSIGFRLMFPAQDAAYPDGSPFFYQNIISLSELEKAKAASPEFDTINVSRMAKEDGAAIDIAANANGETDPEGPYILHLEGIYFASADQAENFCRVLVNLAVSDIQEKADNLSYTVDKAVFQGTPFEDRLSLLKEQRDVLLGQYDVWIENYSEAYRVPLTEGEAGSGGITLGNRRAQVVALYGESIQQELENELDLGGYHFGDLDAYKEQLKLEYEQNKTEIDLISGAIAGASGVGLMALDEVQTPPSAILQQDATLSQRLTALITRNNRISHWLDLENGGKNPTLTEENNEKFAARLDEEYEKLNAASDKLTKAIAAIYANGTSVLFEEQSVTAEGGINAILGTVIVLVVSFAAACAIVCAVERSKSRTAGAKKQ